MFPEPTCTTAPPEMSHYDYLLEKVRAATFTTEPFRHIRLDEFLAPDDFRALISAMEVNIAPATSDAHLFSLLFQAGYQIIHFPGCITDKGSYIRWHKHRKGGTYHSACEGFGMTLRLTSPRSPAVASLKSFLEGELFNRALAEKFDLDLDACSVDCGIQKYLDGYEISPHPDVRRKALTFMVNVNPHPNSTLLEHHTHYMRLRPQRQYVSAFWAGNPQVDRCWVPWDWCETVSVQRQNNSIVVFAPNDVSLHAVRARYDHLKGQRTQLYGNLWFKQTQPLEMQEWDELDLLSAARRSAPRRNTRSILSRLLPGPVKRGLKAATRLVPARAEVGKRNY